MFSLTDGKTAIEYKIYKAGEIKMENKFIIDTEENRVFMDSLCCELLDFGKEFASPNGASYYLGDDGKPWKERPRETWITCRMAHVYSMGAMMNKEGCEQLAAKAIKGLLNELHDSKSGGWYAGVTNDGSIIENKQCYAHAFVILAGATGTLAGIQGAKQLLNMALEIYDDKFWDEKEGLAVDTWNTEFTSLDDYRGLNANMHSVEAFLAAADVLDDEKYRKRAGRIIDRVINWAENNEWRIPEHFTSEWAPDLECNKEKPDDPFKPYGATPGHGIEWARLIVQWALSMYKEDKKGTERYINAAISLYNRAVNDAWNCDGAPGIVYTTDWKGGPVVHDRMHWTLAEAINTSSVLYRVTKNDKYAKDYSMFLEYLEDKVHDHENGSWFHQLDKNNKLLTTVWPGKSDIYHAFQATIIPYAQTDISIACDINNRYSVK